MTNYSRRPRFNYINDEQYIWCFHEKEYIHHTNFEKNKKGQYKLYCENCTNEYVIEKSKKILETLGYDCSSELTVHQQFLIRHQENINQEKVYNKKTKKKRT